MSEKRSRIGDTHWQKLVELVIVMHWKYQVVEFILVELVLIIHKDIES